MANLKTFLFGERNRIGRRLMVLIIAFSSAIMLLISVVQLAFEYSELRSGMEQELDGVSIYVPSIAGSVWDFDEKQIRLALDALVRLPRIDRVVISTADRRKQWSAGIGPSTNIVTRTYALHHETRGKQTEIGRIEVTASLDAIYRQLAASAMAIVFSNGVKTFLVAIFMTFLFRHVVTDRLERLALKVNQLAPRLLPLRQAVETEPHQIPEHLDELDTVDWTLDNTAEDLGIAVKSLQNLNAELESRVDQRTAELSEANDELTTINMQLADTHQQLLQSEKLASIGQLAAGVAHEINNPIGFINANFGALEKYLDGLLSLIAFYERHEASLKMNGRAVAELDAMKREVGLDYLKEDLPALVSESREGLDRVARIVKNLKDFSHVGESDWHMADLHHGLDSTLKLLQSEFETKADVVKQYGFLPEVECLPSELNQVFLNLLINASQAMTERGVITIRTGVDAEQVWIDIADTGHGIEPEHLPRIFDPFFTTRPVGQGIGLGLSMSYSIVKKHKGKIEVESEFGRGTRFRIILPRSRIATGKSSVA